MNRLALLTVLTLLLLALAPAAMAQTEPTTPATDEAARIAGYRALIRQRMVDDGLVGVSAALVVKGKVVWAEGFGQADREAGVPMTPQTVVGIGSVTKTFTALGLMQLQSRGRLDITRPVSRYLPQFHIATGGADPAAITVRSVMTHTSGLPTSVFQDIGLESARYTDAVRLLNQTQLAARPGIVGLYSNIGYSLLGQVIDKVSGQPYPDYVAAHILRPLGMRRSGFITDAGLPAPTRLYYPDGRLTPPFELRDQPAGGLYTDVDDLALYAQGMMDAWNGRRPDLLDQASARAMFSLQNGDIRVETNNKGLGWFMFREGDRFAMYHSGSTVFSNAALLLIPQQDVAAIILVNTVGGDGLAQDFAFKVLEDHGLKPASIRPAPHLPPIDPAATLVTPPDSVLAGTAGDYAQKNRFLTVTRIGDDLALTRDETPLLLRPMSDGGFQPFERGADGALTPLAGQRYRFTEVGPYRVLFHQTSDRETQLGYRVEVAPLSSAWIARLGTYRHFGYQMPGPEQILAARIERIDGRLPMLRLTYNTGDYSYPLVITGPNRAITGGLGPELTGEAVTFSPDGQVLTYSGLTFRRAPGA